MSITQLLQLISNGQACSCYVTAARHSVIVTIGDRSYGLHRVGKNIVKYVDDIRGIEANEIEKELYRMTREMPGAVIEVGGLSAEELVELVLMYG